MPHLPTEQTMAERPFQYYHTRRLASRNIQTEHRLLQRAAGPSARAHYTQIYAHTIQPRYHVKNLYVQPYNGCPTVYP